MLKRLLGHLVLVFLALFPGCNSPGSKSPDQAFSETGLSPAKTSWEKGSGSAPDKVVDQEGVFATSLPDRGIVLALSRWGSTSLVAFNVTTGTQTPLATAETGELVASFAGDKIAYLVRKGVHPVNNYVEILNLRRKVRQLVQPASEFAILGFALSSSGSQLFYSEINLRWSNSRRNFWRIGVADLEKQETHILMASGNEGRPEEGIPVPFAWSNRSREIYLQRLLPFRGMVSQGIWAMKPDGSGLRRVLSEPSYAGLPRLSPDGDVFAYLATKVDALPRDYTPNPGRPPGNVLIVMSPTTGEETIWAQKIGSAFGAFAWSPGERELVVSQQEWSEGQFRDAAFLGIEKKSSRELKKIALRPWRKITDIHMCRRGPFFWVEEDGKGASLRGDGGGPSPTTFLTLPEGKIKPVGCLGE